MAVELDFGDSFSVLLVDGIEETPYVGGTLRMSEAGVEVEVPYLPGHMAPQFEHVDAWFRRMAPPENLLVRTRDGNVTLYGCRWSGHSEAAGSRVGTGRFMADETLLHDRDGDLAEPLAITTCQSRIDGLNRWSRVTAVDSDVARDKETDTNTLVVHVTSPEPIEWRQGEAIVRVRATWRFSQREDGYGRTHLLDDNVVVETEWAEARPFADHLIEQEKVRQLLVFLFGTALSFREHLVHDESIAARTMGGTIYGHPWIELISRRTVRDRAQPVPTAQKLGRPLLVLEELGGEGLAAWAEAYRDWERFILPAAAIIGRRGRFTEDVVMSTSMSLEAAGQILGKQPGEDATYHNGRRTTSTYVYRCLQHLGIRWGGYIHSQVGLAKAIANNYNTVKHADRGAFPDYVETHLIGEVNELVVRLIAVSLTGRADDLLERFRIGSELWEIRQSFEAYRARIIDDWGTWARSEQDAEPGEQPLAGV